MISTIKDLRELIKPRIWRSLYDIKNINSFFDIKDQGKGNESLFRSFSEIMYGNETNHLKIKKQLRFYYFYTHRGKSVYTDIFYFSDLYRCKILLFTDYSVGCYQATLIEPLRVINIYKTKYLYFNGSNFKAMIPKKNPVIINGNQVTKKRQNSLIANDEIMAKELQQQLNDQQYASYLKKDNSKNSKKAILNQIQDDERFARGLSNGGRTKYKRKYINKTVKKKFK